MQDKPSIRIDYREKNSSIANILRERGCDIKEELLPLGDFIFNDLIIERKTIKDFQLSVIDGRLFRQIYTMKLKYRRCLLIIEDNAEEISDNIQINAAQGALIQVTVGWQVPYLFSRSASDTAQLVEHVIKQESGNAKAMKTRYGYKPKGQDRRRLYLLEGIKGVGPKRAKALLNRFGTLHNIFNASISDLTSVKGINESLATSIYNLIRVK